MVGIFYRLSLLISIKYGFVLSFPIDFFFFFPHFSTSLSISFTLFRCLYSGSIIRLIYLNWKINVLNPSYLHLRDPSAYATERSGASETPTYRTNVSIPFHSHCIPRPPFRSVPMCQCDHSLLR